MFLRGLLWDCSNPIDQVLYLWKVHLILLSLQCFQSTGHSPGTSISSPSLDSQESLWGDKGHRDPDLSEDEDMVPDPPAFTELFLPSLFKPLLHRARSTTKLGVQTAPPEVSLDPADGLFQEPNLMQEEIPVPRLFIDVIQKQWDHPGPSLPRVVMTGVFTTLARTCLRFYSCPQWTVWSPIWLRCLPLWQGIWQTISKPNIKRWSLFFVRPTKQQPG